MLEDKLKTAFHCYRAFAKYLLLRNIKGKKIANTQPEALKLIYTFFIFIFLKIKPEAFNEKKLVFFHREKIKNYSIQKYFHQFFHFPLIFLALFYRILYFSIHINIVLYFWIIFK